MNLAAARKKRRLTQAEVADKLGTSRSAVANWETGQARPDTDNAIALADLLRVPLRSVLQLRVEKPRGRGARSCA